MGASLSRMLQHLDLWMLMLLRIRGARSPPACAIVGLPGHLTLCACQAGPVGCRRSWQLAVAGIGAPAAQHLCCGAPSLHCRLSRRGTHIHCIACAPAAEQVLLHAEAQDRLQAGPFQVVMGIDPGRKDVVNTVGAAAR